MGGLGSLLPPGILFLSPSYIITSLPLQVVFHVSSVEICFATEGNNIDSPTVNNKKANLIF